MSELRIERDLKRGTSLVSAEPVQREGYVEVPYMQGGRRVAWTKHADVVVPEPEPEPQPEPEPVPPAFLRQSGVAAGPGDVSATQRFATWRQRSVEIVCDFTDRTAAGIANPWVLDRYKSTPWDINLGLIPWPTGGSDAKAANGEYVNLWKSAAAKIKDYGAGRVILRIGHECNGEWYEWGRSPADFIRWWRLAHDVFSTGAPGVRFDFNTIIGHQDWTKLYPGDAYVDYVTIDPYDTVGALANVKAGCDKVFAFARAHGKLTGLPEWGVTGPPSQYGQGDNPAYIQLIHDLIVLNSDIVGFECYYERNETDGTHMLQTTFPRSGAKYLELW